MNNDFSMDPLEGSKNSFNLGQFFATAKANWYWILLSIFACLMIVFFYLRYSTPIYTTSAQILIQSEQGAEASVLNELSGFNTSVQSIENEVMILKTKQLMETVVSDLKSNIKYLHKGDVLDVELYDSPFIIKLLDSAYITRPMSFELKFSGNTILLTNEEFSKSVKFFQPFNLDGIGNVQIERTPGTKLSDGEYILKMSTVQGTASQLSGNLGVSLLVKGLNVLTLSINNAVPEKSEDLLNRLVQNYIKTVQLDKHMIADSTIAFIENRLMYVGAELGDIEGNVESFKQQNKLTDIATQAGQLVSSGSQFTEELAQIETQLSILASIRQYLESEGNDKRVLPSGALIADPTFNALVGRYNTLVQERERSGLSQTANNPYIQNLDAQITGVRVDILKNFENLKNTLEISRRRLRTRASIVEGQVRNVPTMERTFLDLSRQQQIKQQLYIYLLQKREEIGIAKTTDVTNCKIIESPSSSGPVSPNSPMLWSVGFLTGLALPLLMIYLSGLFNSKISTKDDVLRNTHMPIVAEISSTKDKEVLIVSKNPRSPIAEQFRALRTNLSYFLKEGEKTILVTSSRLGEGKSFVSLNLATMLALSGKKVLLMEMDLRKPSLTKKLNLDNEVGITSYIIKNDLSLEDIIRPSGIQENLYLLSSGPIPPNPAETILQKRMDELMKSVLATYDYVILDAPPVGQVSDAQLLNKYADLTLYLVRQRYTELEHLAIAEDLYVNQKMNNMALVINDISASASHGYKYEYGYGYE